MKTKIMFWLTFALAIAAIVYFATRTLMVAGGYDNFIKTNRVSVSFVSDKIPAEQIITAAALAPNAATPDINATLAGIMTIPEVENASVRRMPNGNLILRVKKRDIIAQWTDGTNFYPLSSNGRPVNSPSDARAENVLLFRGKLPDNIADITYAVRKFPNVSARVDYLEFVENRRWNATTDNGIEIKLPEYNADAAIAALANRQKHESLLDRKIAFIDMRNPERILLKLK